MTVEELLQYLTWALFLAIFVVAAARAIRRPSRINVDIALLSGAPVVVIASGVVAGFGLFEPSPVTSAINGTLVLAIAYLLLRLVADFRELHPVWLRLAEAGLVLLGAGLTVFPPPRPDWLTFAAVAYFVGLQVVVAVAFARQAGQSTGITRRRMLAVAAGSLFLGLTIFSSVLPLEGTPLDAWTSLLPLAAASLYFLGFATPAALRRLWQDRELRALLQEVPRLVRIENEERMVSELEHRIGLTFGATAAIGLWEEERGRLVFRNVSSGKPDEADARVYEVEPGEMVVGRVFADQQARAVADAVRADPQHAAVYRSFRSTAVLAAPLSVDERRFGVITVYAARPSVFADDDLDLLRLIADQVAVILESRLLAAQSAELRAREEVTRLKEEFLSAAAHDLKTPLTVLLTQAQLLERRAVLYPEAPVDIEGLRRMVTEIKRASSMVSELLDTIRLRGGRLIEHRHEVDLAEVVRGVVERERLGAHSIVADVDGPVVGQFDRARIEQLLENLIENAIKYSPQGGAVRVALRSTTAEAELTVEDSGVGIPADELATIFDPFRRASNVDERYYAGLGLGLAICSGIAEQHGGRIWATSELGHGSQFHVVLPLGQDHDDDPGGR